MTGLLEALGPHRGQGEIVGLLPAVYLFYLGLIQKLMTVASLKNILNRKVIRRDRGQQVQEQERGYEHLATAVFEQAKVDMRHDIYGFLIRL